jgi:hypothetical protein
MQKVLIFFYYIQKYIYLQTVSFLSAVLNFYSGNKSLNLSIFDSAEETVA